MDLTVDCIIEFKEAVFTGTYPRAKYSHERTIKGRITKDSYGNTTGQHTFTIEVFECDDNSISIGEKIRRKGRNVYKKCEVLSYPENHKELADDKHERSRSVKDGIAMQKSFEKGDHQIYERYSKQ